MGALRFVTWNVNGAGSREKKLKIFSQLKKLQADVVLLQETHRPATATDQFKQLSFLMCSPPAITLGKGG